MTIQDLGPEMRELAERTKRAELELHRQVHRSLRHKVEEKSPVDDGGYKLAHSSSVRTPKKGGAVATVLPSIRRAVPSFVVNPAPHAIIVEMEGQVGKGGRRLGSRKAPGGVYDPALRELASEMDAIAQSVLDRMLGGGA